MAKKDKWTFPIVVFNNTIDDAEFSLAEARKNYFFGPKEIILKEIVLLENAFLTSQLQKLLEIINEHNDSMIGIFEDDIIYSNSIKLKCLTEIEKQDFETAPLISEVITLFRLAIEHQKNIYFLF